MLGFSFLPVPKKVIPYQAMEKWGILGPHIASYDYFERQAKNL